MEAVRTDRRLTRVSSPRSRLVELTRRDALRRALIVSGSLAVAPSLIAACGGTSDEAALGGADGDADSSNGTAPTVAPAGSPSTSTEPTSAGASTAEPAATATTASTAGADVPGGGSLTVDFTFAPSGGGRIRNPYVAVWIEDTDGGLVDTLAVWYQERERKYLRELTRWMSVDGSDESLATVSSATKVAGTYSLSWDLTDAAGVTVPAGEYVVCVEAAREHGPYDLVIGPVTVGTDAATVDLGADNELTGVRVTYAV